MEGSNIGWTYYWDNSLDGLRQHKKKRLRIFGVPPGFQTGFRIISDAVPLVRYERCGKGTKRHTHNFKQAGILNCSGRKNSFF